LVRDNLSNIDLGHLPSNAIWILFYGIEFVWWYARTDRYYEVAGMVASMDTPEMTITEMVFVNTIYELDSFCTSIVATQADGQIIHGRMMDFGYANHLRNIGYKAKFVRGDEEVHESTMFAGTVGVFTGMKPNAFSVSINQRTASSMKNYPEESRTERIAYNIMGILAGFEEASWLTRYALENCTDFECARSILKNTWTNSLVYFALGGTKNDEGVVISRNLLDVAHEEKLDVNNGKWFIA